MKIVIVAALAVAGDAVLASAPTSATHEAIVSASACVKSVKPRTPNAAAISLHRASTGSNKMTSPTSR